jgi:diacylglycerol kinase family enzyme
MEPAPDLAALVAAAAPPLRPIPQAAKALVFFNEKAGSVGPNDRQKLVDTLATADIGQYALVDAEHISPELFKHAADFDVIIVLGGDGTARAAADLAPRDGPPLVLLPGGTLNILPRALYGELAWPEALTAALERGVTKKLPLGRANGQSFYVAALFGGTTMLVHAREAVREGKPLTAWRRFRVALRRSFTRSLRARPNNQRMQKAEAIGVLLPSFSGGIEADDLEWVRLDARHIFDLARVSLRAITAGWRKDGSVEISRCKSGDVDVALGYIHATLDGEPHRFYSRVHIKYDANGPRVLALEPEEGAQ